jgi:hypothetical protein
MASRRRDVTIDLFALMLVGHLAGDFLLQTAWMANNKTEEWIPMLAHCFIYTAAVALFALPAGGLTIPAIVFIFLGHAFVDRRKLVGFWSRYISRSPDNVWLKIIQDQTWHIVVLTVVAFW